MMYIKVLCDHDEDDQPVQFFIELDDDNFENRKVMIYRDGSVERASAEIETPRAYLSPLALPSLDEINEDPEFTGTEISRDEFEKKWNGLE